MLKLRNLLRNWGLHFPLWVQCLRPPNSGGFGDGWNRQRAWSKRAILDAGIQDQEQWAQNVEGPVTCEVFQKRDQCLRLSPSLFSSKSGLITNGLAWNTSMTVTDHMQKINMFWILFVDSTCFEFYSTSLLSASTMMPPQALGIVIIRVICAPSPSEQLQQRWISWVSSLYLGTVGGEKGMRQTRVEYTQFTVFFITYVWVNFLLNIVTTPPPRLLPPTKLRDAEATHQLRNWAFCSKMLRNSTIRNWGLT